MISRRRFIVAVVALTGLTVISGLVEGHLGGRWHDAEQLEAAANGLEDIPHQIGPWVMRDEQELSAYAKQVLQCSGSLNRIYEHQETGATISVALVVGPHGPISVHTPEICYSSRDYELQSRRQRVAFHNRDQLWLSTFQPLNIGDSLLHVYYGWNDGTGWSAPSEPRFSFAGNPYLYKLQLAAHVQPDDSAQMENMGADFLQQFLPILDQRLLKRASSI